MSNKLPKLPRWLWPLVAALFLILLILWSAGVFRRNQIAPGKDSIPPGRPAPAQTGAVVQVIQPVYYEAVGTVRPRHEVTVAAQITGRVLAVPVEEGDSVEAQSMLVRLDDRELAARLEQARQDLASRRAEAERARLNHERIRRLVAREAATEDQWEAATARFKQTEAEAEAARQRIAEAETALGHATILSAATGVISQRLVDPGDLAVPGKPLLVLHDPRAMRLEAAIREGLADAATVGDKVEIELTAFATNVTGIIEEVVPATDPVSRSFVVKVGLPHHERLFSGMFGRLRLPLGERSALTVPREALIEVGQLRMILVREDDGRWRRRYVTTGREWQDRVEILSGVDDHETIGWNPRDKE